MPEVSKDIAALVLFLSRERVDPQDYDLAKTLCAKVDDWNLVASIAVRKFIIPMVYSNLSKIQPENLPSSALEDMKAKALMCSMMSLKMAAAQSTFHQLCIAPLNCDHVFLKGMGLARRYYRNPGMRYARDVDVLVSEDAIEHVVRLALSNGYRIKIKEDVLTDAPCERTLRAWLEYNQIMTMLAPDSVWIEVHTHIDYGLELFDPVMLLETAVSLDGKPDGPCVPATAELFCFVCYHNTRHTWSRLHWLADINAMMDHPSFVLDDVMDFATSIGLEPTVSATLEFKRLAEMAEWVHEDQERDSHVRTILDHCIANLADDFETEMKLRSRFGYLGLPYPWMLNKSAKLPAYFHRTLARVTPSYYLYEAIPLPKYLQWLYYPVKPIFVFWHRIILGKTP